MPCHMLDGAADPAEISLAENSGRANRVTYEDCKSLQRAPGDGTKSRDFKRSPAQSFLLAAHTLPRRNRGLLLFQGKGRTTSGTICPTRTARKRLHISGSCAHTASK